MALVLHTEKIKYLQSSRALSHGSRLPPRLEYARQVQNASKEALIVHYINLEVKSELQCRLQGAGNVKTMSSNVLFVASVRISSSKIGKTSVHKNE